MMEEAIPSRLYKFVTPARLDIFDKFEIRFTQPDALNDPFELRPLFSAIFPESVLKEIIRSIDTTAILNKLRVDIDNRSHDQATKARAEAMLDHYEKNPRLLQPFIKQTEKQLRGGLKIYESKAQNHFHKFFSSAVGILSTSARIDDPLLWAHYAESHRGFALILNPASSFFNQKRSGKDELYHLRPVRYQPAFDANKTFMDMKSDDLFAAKQSSWSYEDEWRMLVPLQDADRTIDVDGEQIHLFRIPPDAISGFVAGARSSPELFAALMDTLETSAWRHLQPHRAILNSKAQRVEMRKC